MHSSSIACFQSPRCELSMACAHVNASLLLDVDARAFAMMITAFAEIFN